MRPVGGSAAEASDGGVGARGGKSGGVAPDGTAKTGVKAASAARHFLIFSEVRRYRGALRHTLLNPKKINN